MNDRKPKHARASPAAPSRQPVRAVASEDIRIIKSILFQVEIDDVEGTSMHNAITAEMIRDARLVLEGLAVIEKRTLAQRVALARRRLTGKFLELRRSEIGNGHQSHAIRAMRMALADIDPVFEKLRDESILVAITSDANVYERLAHLTIEARGLGFSTPIGDIDEIVERERKRLANTARAKPEKPERDESDELPEAVYNDSAGPLVLSEYSTRIARQPIKRKRVVPIRPLSKHETYVSIDDLAKRSGRSVSTIRRRCKLLGIPVDRSRITRADVDKIIAKSRL